MRLPKARPERTSALTRRRMSAATSLRSTPTAMRRPISRLRAPTIAARGGIKAEPGQEQGNRGERRDEQRVKALRACVVRELHFHAVRVDHEKKWIDVRDDGLRRFGVLHWVSCHAEQDVRTHQHRGLGERQGDHGLRRRGDGILLRIGNHADNFTVTPDGGIEVIAIHARVAEVGTDMPAYGVFIGKVSFDESLVHDGDERRLRVVVGDSKAATADQRYAESLEESRLGVAYEC